MSEEEKSKLNFEYVYCWDDLKKETSILTKYMPVLGSLLFMFLIPIVVDLILLIIALLFDFIWEIKMAMIVFPVAFIFVALLAIAIFPLALKYTWKEVQKLPLERQWTFTQHGIYINQTYLETNIPWELISNIQETKWFILFNFSDKRFFNMAFQIFPKRVLSSEQRKQLFKLFIEWLGSEKVKLKTPLEQV
ncbi:hypothetical protein DRO91_03290 [Candidatus Heimdallarchaeota archaeon]|nr:MAG: hypothetical protein DRO91_03290 [Candidatus Heimdallarchaeota archaeon]